MAHPHAEHRQNKVERARVAHITKGYASGGAVGEAKANMAAIKSTMKKPTLRMNGGKVKYRADKRARGGKVKRRDDGGAVSDQYNSQLSEAAQPTDNNPLNQQMSNESYPNKDSGRTGNKRGGAVKRARGGKVKRRDDGGPVESDQGQQASLGNMSSAANAGLSSAMSSGQNSPSLSQSAGDEPYNRPMSNKSFPDKDSGRTGNKRGGAVKRARGGRTKHKGTNVNVIVAPQHADGGAPMMMPHPMGPAPAVAGPPPAPPPMAGPPPGMPPRPMMAPPGAGGPMPPGMPVRAKGGEVTMQPGLHTYKSGGGVKSGPAWEEGLKSGTQVQHTDNKSDGKNIGRGRVVTFRVGGGVGQTSGTAGAGTAYRESTKRVKPIVANVKKMRAAGGPVEASNAVDPATKLPGGAGGGEGRLAKERRARK